jgi:hypothetical protein
VYLFAATHVQVTLLDNELTQVVGVAASDVQLGTGAVTVTVL